jgi:hypothetical protein
MEMRYTYIYVGGKATHKLQSSRYFCGCREIVGAETLKARLCPVIFGGNGGEKKKNEEVRRTKHIACDEKWRKGGLKT